MNDERLKRFFSEQIDFLKLSCEAFDRGYLHESKRLATTIRVLLHDTRNSISLLNQIGLKDKLGYIDTCFDFNEKNLLTHNGILVIQMTKDGVKYIAPLSDTPLGINHSKSFNEWWNKVIFARNKDDFFTRKQIILELANKEGGAHVDPNLNDIFNSLSNGKYLNSYFVIEKGKIQLEHAPAFAVRQIAFELIESIERNAEPNNKPTTL